MAKIFSEYADTVFVPYVDRELKLHNAHRIDLVWDAYIADSIKASTRQKRGKIIRRRVLGKTQVPSNWKDFLRVDDNKTELFEFLIHAIMNRPHIETVYVTYMDHVLTSRNRLSLYQPV